MANAVALTGKDTKVTLGANKVLGIGNWELSGITTDQIDVSEFDNNWKFFEFGMKDGGAISFAGVYDKADSTGQEELQEMQVNNTDLTSLRLYLNSVSYFTPCATIGYLTPALTSAQDTIVSHVNVTGVTITDDMSDVIRISFECKVSGAMVLI